MAPRSAPPVAAALSSSSAACSCGTSFSITCSSHASFSTTSLQLQSRRLLQHYIQQRLQRHFSVAAPPSAPRPFAAPHSLQRHRHCSAYRGRRDTASRLIPAAVHRICSRCALRSSLGRSVLCRRSDLSCRRVVCKCQFASTPSRRGGAVIQSRGRSNRSRDRDRRRPTQAPCRRGGQ